MITKTEVYKSSVGCKKGWAFAVYFNNREYPNLISSLSKTQEQATNNLRDYIKTGAFSLYGNAE